MYCPLLPLPPAMAFDIGATLLCDGSFDGLLTALFYAEATRPRAAEILLEPPMQSSLLTQPTSIATEPDKADRVCKAIRRKLPGEAYWILQSVFSSYREDRGTLLMRYLRVGWRVGKQLNDQIADPDVWEATKVSKQVGHEVHKLSGLLRFRPVRGVYYCAFTPDNDVVQFLAPHFADRLSDQHWLIHDLSRSKGAVFDKDRARWTILPLPDFQLDTGMDDPFIALWRTYHKTIAIEARKNEGLQRQFMPKRYWKHLFEMQDLPPKV